jgi:MYXO-CTERM domain-containing protein
MAEVSFDVQAPAVTEETPFAEDLVLVDGGTQIGGVQLALTVVPDMTEPSSSDGENEYDQEVSGGCSTTGGSGSLGLALAALAVVFRFRRRR